MHVRKLITILFCSLILLPFNMMAKEAKPTMLVYGDNVEAFAAAVQASRSNVPTIWVVPAATFANELLRNQLSITTNDSLDGGIWLDLLRKVAKADLKSDSLIIAIKRHLNPQEVKDALNQIIQQEKNLKVVYNSKISKLERGKKDWSFVLSNKEKYDVRSIVDASSDGQLKSFLKGDETYLKPGRIFPIQEISTPLRRTLVAIGEHKGKVWGYTLSDILSRNKENLFFISSLIQVEADEESIPLRMQVGQALGAVAGYCAFFKTTADKIDVRKLQAELFAFDVRLLPFKNISTFSPNFTALQRIFLTGIYAEDNNLQNLTFNKKAEIPVASIHTTFNQMYSRSQLWFKNNEKEILDLNDLLALIKNVAFRGDEIDQLVEREWQSKLKFERDFAQSHLEKYEFEVLLDKYANPFAKTIDHSGNILR